VQLLVDPSTDHLIHQDWKQKKEGGNKSQLVDEKGVVSQMEISELQVLKISLFRAIEDSRWNFDSITLRNHSNTIRIYLMFK